MRHRIGIFVVLGVCVLAAPSFAQTAGSVEGFGGVSFSTGDQAFKPNLGGTVSFALTPNLHFVGEGGHLGNVLSPLADSIYASTALGVDASALYFEGGIRLLGAPTSVVSPYAEATAGAARISLHTTGLGSIGDAALPIALSMVPRTGPVAGLGGGVVIHAGAMQVDFGYRFKQLYPPDALNAALGLGQDLHSHQVRVGIGVRF
jgi:hypothetical protein